MFGNQQQPGGGGQFGGGGGGLTTGFGQQQGGGGGLFAQQNKPQGAGGGLFGGTNTQQPAVGQQTSGFGQQQQQQQQQQPMFGQANMANQQQQAGMVNQQQPGTLSDDKKDINVADESMQPKDSITDIVFHPKQLYVFACSCWDGKIQIYNIVQAQTATGQAITQLKTIPVAQCPIIKISFKQNNDNTLYAACGDGTIKVVDIQSGKFLFLILIRSSTKFLEPSGCVLG